MENGADVPTYVILSGVEGDFDYKDVIHISTPLNVTASESETTS